jgi:uncharacterized membrane protein YphA (DoxX/SURF4 family)
VLTGSVLPRGGLLVFAAILETIGAAFFLVGAFTRIVTFVLSNEMSFAYFMAHAPRSFSPSSTPESWRSCSASYSFTSPLQAAAR